MPGVRDRGSSSVFIVPDYQRGGTPFTLYTRQNGNELTIMKK
ncbi:hypothetical protein [Arsenicibacter rosenii]|nr:hypothetical protein [Arsenicibacter rosenii]